MIPSFINFFYYFWIEISLYACFNVLAKSFLVKLNFFLLGFSVLVFILFLIASNWKLLLRLLKNSIAAGIPLIITKSLVLGMSRNSLMDLYFLVSFLSLGIFFVYFLFLYTCKSQYDVILDWIPCTAILSYVTLDSG